MIRTEPIDDAPRQEAPVSSPVPVTPLAHGPWLLALVLVLVTLVAYLPVLRAGFVWDDDANLTANLALTAPHGLSLIWHSLAVGRYYPLTLTSFWLERRLWGLAPLPYHVVNVLLHALNGVLVYFLLRRLRIPAAWLVAMIWVLHPVNVESVAWITEMKNTQSALFFFLSILCFLRFVEQKEQHLRWYTGYIAGVWYLLAFVCTVAAMLSQASTAILPVAMLLAVWWQRGHWERADAARIFPFVAMSWLIAGLAYFGQHGPPSTAGPAEWRLGFIERLIVPGKAVWFYAAKLLWPVPVTFIYPRWALHVSSPWSWLPTAALVALAVLVWRWRRRPWCRAVLFGGGFFVLALLPALGFFNLSYFRYAFVADRFQYLASVGLITLACGGSAVLWRRASHVYRAVAAVALTGLLAALGTLTWRQTLIYQNQETLWGDTIAKNPQCWLAHYALAIALEQAGRTEESVAHYQQVLRIRPEDAVVHNNLATVFLHEGKVNDAIGQYEQALRIDPNLAQAHFGLAGALSQSNRIEDAIAQYQQALQIYPDYVEAHNNLANVFLLQGQLSNAIGQYEQAVEIKPALPQLHYNLADALARAGRTKEAIAQLQQTLRINPDYPEARYSLGTMFVQQGKFSDAIQQLERALRLKPNSPDIHFSLASALSQAGWIEEAIAHYQQALRLKPDYAAAHCNLGSALVQIGNLPEAIAQYQQALRLEPDFVEAHCNLGNALSQLGRLPEAIAQYERALRIQPDFAEGHYNLAHALEQAGRTDDAIAQYQQTLRLRPDYAEAHFGLGNALDDTGRTDEAFAHYEEALWLKPDYAPAQAALEQLHVLPRY